MSTKTSAAKYVSEKCRNQPAHHRSISAMPGKGFTGRPPRPTETHPAAVRSPPPGAYVSHMSLIRVWRAGANFARRIASHRFTLHCIARSSRGDESRRDRRRDRSFSPPQVESQSVSPSLLPGRRRHRRDTGLPEPEPGHPEQAGHPRRRRAPRTPGLRAAMALLVASPRISGLRLE